MRETTDHSPGPEEEPVRNTIDYVIMEFSQLAEGWHKEAERRRTLDDRDALANVYDLCAQESLALGTLLIEQLHLVTVEKYAELNRITVQTVRRWCHNGQLTYFTDERGMMIPRQAVRQPEMRGDS